VLDEVDWASSRLDAASWAGWCFFRTAATSTNSRRLSLLLLVLAALPPSMLPEGALADLLAERRGQVAVVGVVISLSAAIVLGIVFWAL
jgi:hypothetical protein